MRCVVDYPKCSLQLARYHCGLLTLAHRNFTNNFLVSCRVLLLRITDFLQLVPRIAHHYHRAVKFAEVKPFLFTESLVVLYLLTRSILSTPIFCG